MTRKYEEYQEVRTYKREIEIICDWCGIVFEDEDGFDYQEFKLKFVQGVRYPEYGDAKGWAVEDLCANCAGKLRQVLIELGVTVAEIDRDW